MSDETEKTDEKFEDSASIEEVKQELIRERRERAKAGKLLQLERGHMVFVVFVLFVGLLGSIYLFGLPAQVVTIIGGVTAMVIVIGLIMSPQKNSRRGSKP